MGFDQEQYRLGGIAYTAYVKQTGGMSLATGDKLPGFDDLKPAMKDAWTVAALAVREAVLSS